MKKYLITIIIAIIVIFTSWYIADRFEKSALQTHGLISSVQYICNDNKIIHVNFYENDSIASTNENMPPVPGGSVKIKLNNENPITLTQTISADGGRYANKDESFVFWSKGNTALVLENNQQKNYTGCVVIANQPQNSDLSSVYGNETVGFTLRLPKGFTVDQNYIYQEFGPAKEISGIKFTIPTGYATGTNLARDSYISVEKLPKAKNCTADLFLTDTNVRARNSTENGTDYSVASSTGAGAGNRYEETVYAIPYSNPCIAIRYFIHYGIIENYPVGMVKEFDRQMLLQEFTLIRNTFVIGK